jgi:benzil reductase ((S)-benzoin forming)
MRYHLITGISSGIGEALAARLILHGDNVIGLSRNDNPMLRELAGRFGIIYRFIPADLSETGKLPALVRTFLKEIDKKDLSGVSLINNAGTIEPVGFSGTTDSREIKNHYLINLVAPAVLANEFIRLSRRLRIRKTIVNISSGAAHKPYEGWSSYCSGKAGLNMLTRTLGAEQKKMEFPVRVISVAPGVVDTPMQKLVRESNETEFPMRRRFAALHEGNKLLSPQTVAERIASLLFDDSIEGGSVIDLREFRHPRLDW